MAGWLGKSRLQVEKKWFMHYGLITKLFAHLKWILELEKVSPQLYAAHCIIRGGHLQS